MANADGSDEAGLDGPPDDHGIPLRPPHPTPYNTSDQVSPAFRRIGGYAWRLAAIGVVLWGLFVLVAPLQTLILALFFALLVTAWLMPLTNWLARALPRWLAGVIALVAFTIAVGLVVTFIGLQTASQWEGIASAFNQGVIDLQTWLREGPFHVTDAQLTSVYQSAEQFIRESGGDIALGVLSGVGSVLGVFTALAAALFILVFLLIQPQVMFRWFVGWLPARNREVIAQSVRIAWDGFSQYSQGLVLVAVTNAILVTIVLLIMGVPLAIPLGIIVFFGAFIPYIGAPIAMLLAAFVALVTDGPLAGALVVVLIFVIGQLEGNVLQPLIMGQTVNLHPVAIVLVTAVGAAYFGLLGALIGVPLAAGVYGAMRYLTGPIRHDDGTPPEPAPPGEGTF